MFVDFTAAWCVTCQVNKRLVLNTDDVRAAFAERSVALVRADWTRRDPAITQALAALGRSGVPVYVLYRPGKAPLVLPEVLQQSTMRERSHALATICNSIGDQECEFPRLPLSLFAVAMLFAPAAAFALSPALRRRHSRSPTPRARNVQLADYRGKYVVLEWTNPECPFVRKHYTSGNMQGAAEGMGRPRGRLAVDQLDEHHNSEFKTPAEMGALDELAGRGAEWPH